MAALMAAPGAAGGQAAMQPGAVAPQAIAPDTVRCLQQTGTGTGSRPRIAVGNIRDLSGRVSLESGALLPQGASMFAISALLEMGYPVVERFDMAIAEIEINYARQQLLSDTPELAGQVQDNYRRIYPGQIAGSRFYLTGALTELNTGVSSLSGAASATAVSSAIASLSASGGYERASVALDLRLVDTLSQEVVGSATVRRSLSSGNLSVGAIGATAPVVSGQVAYARSSEVQYAVRGMVEEAVRVLVGVLESCPTQGAITP
ncbi:HfaB protein [Brevundimonas subvibrioides ATCC 15264]|uniref:HfaB protein n=2 Tax=Brevundimonas subvibrioides TaxID=74313 RepID=D9QJV7_BRESC|nr:HfaB protein [Brevundimonas subvibrioides ATCC 15264]